MIWICTLNPSIDYHMDVNELDLGKTNRSNSEHVRIGGKGINVAIVLDALNVTSTIFGFVGGFTGEKIVEELRHYPHIQNEMCRLDKDTRINIKVKGDVETEINGKGQPVTVDEIKMMSQALDRIKVNDVVVLSGSVANGMDYRWYLDTARILSERGIHCVVDFADQSILDILKYKPLLIKPNVSELEKILGVSLESDSDIIKGGKTLVDQGAQSCIISKGSKGSFLITQDDVYTSNVPNGSFVNSVGSGDSMVAGFIAGLSENMSLVSSYQRAVACASATAYSEHLATQSKIDDLVDRVIITNIGGQL